MSYLVTNGSALGAYGGHRGYLKYTTASSGDQYTITINEFGEEFYNTSSSSNTLSASGNSTVKVTVGSTSKSASNNSSKKYTVAGSSSKYVAFSSPGTQVTIKKTNAAQTVTLKVEWTWSGSTRSNSTTITVPKITTYTITYNKNTTDSSVANMPSNGTKTYNKVYTVPSTKPTRTGYTFVNWKISETGYTVSAGGTITEGSNNNYTLLAQWKINTYTISYNANGGSSAPASQTKTYNVALTLSANKPTCTGYTFLGWSTSKTATSATYKASGSYTANSAATLYAVWQAITYTIKYNGNGNTGGTVPSAQTKTYGVTLKLSSTVPTRTNYTFLGWSTSSTATSATYKAGGNYTANAAATLYAVWQSTKPSRSTSVTTLLTGVKAVRINSDGEEDSEGTRVKISGTVNFRDSEGTNREIIIQNSAGTKIGGEPYSNTGTYTFEIQINDKEYLTTSKYDFTVIARYQYSGYNYDVSQPTYVSKSFFIMDFGSKGYTIGIGTQAKSLDNPSESNMRLDIAMPTYFSKSTYFEGTPYLRNGINLSGQSNDETDNQTILLAQVSSYNNCVFGYGSWDKQLGNTHLYGNNVRLYTKNKIDINSNPPIKILKYSKTFNNIPAHTYIGNVAAYEATADRRISFSIPDGYTSLPGAAVNGGYNIIIHNHRWSDAAASVTPNALNNSNDQQNITIYADVICVRTELL